jgi:prepilin-type N-terminal cleavage/methylation domain-containing protein
VTEGDRSRRRGGAERARRRGGAPRGFTLIELMVALAVSSLLVGMIFAIFIRMSAAYGRQQQVAEVQRKLAAARARIELDAKQAGLYLADGFYLARLGAGLKQPPLRVINHADGPDELALYHADASAQVTTRAGGTGTTCTRRECDKLGATDGFAVGDVVVMSTPILTDRYSGPGEAKVARFEACVLQIASLGPSSFVFSEAAPWGAADNAFCPPEAAPVLGTTRFYKLAARHWRIDPARPADGALQLSKLGALIGADDWQDQAYGFTDLQVATRFFEPDDPIDTPDPDADPQRDWSSGEAQEVDTAPAAAFKAPIQLSVSLVARTERDVEGLASASTPSLTVAGNEDHNTIGDRGPIALPSALPALAGNRLYRVATFQIDLRNLGVGR